MKPNKISHKSKTVLLIVDMINDFAFPESKKLVGSALAVAQKISHLKIRASRKGIPIIYVNDNFGLWRSSWQEVYDYCLKSQSRRKIKISSLVRPNDKDYFILKPRHSGFFNTNLPTLLEELGAEKLIITGIAGNICVLFTVNDAYMNDYKIAVPSDCIASNSKRENDLALRQMKEIMKAQTGQAQSLRF